MPLWKAQKHSFQDVEIYMLFNVLEKLIFN